MQTKELKTMVLGPRCGKSTFITSLSVRTLIHLLLMEI